MTRVDLCWLGSTPPPRWAHGEVRTAAATPVAVAEMMAAVEGDGATLYWDGALGAPPIDRAWLDARRVEVVHAGLLLGTAGRPAIIDYIQPTWMWNRDPDPMIEATSWRISLRACLIEHAVIRQLGPVHPGFRTLAAAALELGHRYATRGAFVRHDPALVAGRAELEHAPMSLYDELLFARLRHGTFWARWALGRGLLAGELPAREVADAWQALAVPAAPVRTFVRDEPRISPGPARVSVIMPTIERYPYLRQLLPQLAVQTHPVHEIVVIDQTPAAARDVRIASEFSALPIRLVHQEPLGQCTARNEALRLATGEYALFLDDDDEVEPDVVELHVRTLATYGVDVSCGVVADPKAGPTPESHQFLRASDVFPTNNTMIRRSVLRATGMFDLAFDKKQCEDHDLGMRLYLAGTLMVLDPRISVIHHHAPRGGLRVHGARVVTYASSRQRISHRNLPHMSEVYLAMRYFSPRQVREMLAQRAWGTLRGKQGIAHQGAKVAYGLATLPDTLRKVRHARLDAERLLETYPNIPPLEDGR